jgi:hypothetical protein
MTPVEYLTHQANALDGLAALLWDGKTTHLKGAEVDTCCSVDVAVAYMRVAAKLLRRDAERLAEAKP